MPDLIVFGVMDVEQYAGAYDTSCTKFTRQGLTYFELSLNSDVINGYPLELKGVDSIEFYRRYLQNTNRLDNPFCSTVLTHKQFDNCNFFIVHNFEESDEGQLTCKIKFGQPLAKKMMLLFMPVSEKRLHFDNHFNVVKQ